MAGSPPRLKIAPVGVLVGGEGEEGFGDVVHVGEVAQLVSVPDLEGLPFQQQFYPDAQEGLAGVLDAHARADGVGEAQDGAADAVDVVVEQVEALPRLLVDAVDVHRFLGCFSSTGR